MSICLLTKLGIAGRILDVEILPDEVSEKTAWSLSNSIAYKISVPLKTLEELSADAEGSGLLLHKRLKSMVQYRCWQLCGHYWCVSNSNRRTSGNTQMGCDAYRIRIFLLINLVLMIQFFWQVEGVPWGNDQTRAVFWSTSLLIVLDVVEYWHLISEGRVSLVQAQGMGHLWLEQH